MTRIVAAVGGGWLLLSAASLAAQAGDGAPALPPSAAETTRPPADDAAAQPAPKGATAEAPAAPPSAANADSPADAEPGAPIPPPSAASPTPPDGNPYVPARSNYHRWTAQDVARIRAALAAQRDTRARRVNERAAPGPRVYGDARAPFTIGLDVDVLFRNDVGFHHFDAGESSVRLGAFASYDIVTLAHGLNVGVELGAGFEHDTAPGLLGSGGKADLDSQTVHAGVDLRWDALPVLSPFARATGGASFFQLSFNETTPALETSHATSGFGTLGAGVLLHTAPRVFEDRDGGLASFGIGVLIEGGYALRSPADFALHTHSDAHAITVVDASLGRLTLSSPYLRTAVVLRF